MKENNNALISIIIPTYNRKTDLIRAVNSVISQSYTNWELIIVDNNSVDGTLEYFFTLNNSRIKILSVNNNGLIAYSRNKGIEVSKGEFIAFLDSDDWWESCKLEKSMYYFDQNIDIVYHDLYIVKSLKDKKFKINKAQDNSKSFYLDLLIKGNFISNSSVIVRKSILEKIGQLPMDIEMNSICDYLAWIEISKVTNNFKKIPGVLGYYWIGGGNTTNPERTLNSLKYFRIKYLVNVDPLPIWYNYAIGRSNFVLKKYTEAEKYFKSIVFENNLDFILLSKSLFMFYISKFLKFKVIGITKKI